MSTRIRVILPILGLLWLAHGRADSQIPNPGFENWAGGDPVGWSTSNDPMGAFFNVAEATPAHGGAKALRGEVELMLGYDVQPVIQSGAGGMGFAYTQRSASFTGFYQFAPVGGDRFGVNVILYSGGINGTAVAVAAAALSPAVPTFTAFSVPFQYLSGATPDLCAIQIQIIGPEAGGTPHTGSYYVLDDIALGATTAVGEQADRVPVETRLLQNYPNPFNPSTTIAYQLAGSAFVTLTVHDVLGREVARLVNGMQATGSHSESWDAKHQASGVYYARLTVGNYTETKKLLLTK